MTFGETLSLRSKRLLYRATRRGMRELDTTYGAWVTAMLADADLDEARLTALEDLLEHSEPELLDLLQGRIAPQGEEEKELLRALKEFLQTRYSQQDNPTK